VINGQVATGGAASRRIKLGSREKKKEEEAENAGTMVTVSVSSPKTLAEGGAGGGRNSTLYTIKVPPHTQQRLSFGG